MHWADRRASVAVPDPLSDARMAGIGAIRPELPVRPVGWRCPFSVIARSESRGSRGAVENRHSSESNDCHSSGIPALRRPAQCVASSTCGVLDSQNLLPGRPSGGRCSSSDIRRSAGAPREVRRRLALSHLLGNKRRREKRERTISSDWCCAHSRTRGSPLRAVSGLKESE
jgi:hypothetical protein